MEPPRLSETDLHGSRIHIVLGLSLGFAAEAQDDVDVWVVFASGFRRHVVAPPGQRQAQAPEDLWKADLRQCWHDREQWSYRDLVALQGLMKDPCFEGLDAQRQLLAS